MEAPIFFIRILPLFILLGCNSNSIENNPLVKTVAVRSDGGSLYEMNLDSTKDIMTFKEAKEYAANYGDGWRLPTVMELITLRYKGGNQYFDISTYWSSDVLNDDVIGVYNFYIDKSDYELASEHNYVMLIRKVEWFLLQIRHILNPELFHFQSPYQGANSWPLIGYAAFGIGL